MENLFGFEDKLGISEELEVLQAPDIVNKIESRGILRDGDVIEVWS